MENHKVRCLAGKEANTKTVVHVAGRKTTLMVLLWMAEVLGPCKPRLAGSNFWGMHLQMAEVFDMGKVKKGAEKCFLLYWCSSNCKEDKKRIRGSDHKKKTKQVKALLSLLIVSRCVN